MALLNVQLSPSLEDLVESYDCGEDNTTCPNETTCCTGKRACCPVGSDYQCCNVEDENVSISSLLIPWLPSSSDREWIMYNDFRKYALPQFLPQICLAEITVVSLSISAPSSNTHSQPHLYNIIKLPLVRLFAVQTGKGGRAVVTASCNVLPTAARDPVWCEQNLRMWPSLMGSTLPQVSQPAMLAHSS